MRKHTPAVVLVAALAAALGTSCKIQGERQRYTAIGAEAAALREAFNAAAGKVRLVVLVAPT